MPTGKSGDVVDCGLVLRTISAEELSWPEVGEAVELQRLPLNGGAGAVGHIGHADLRPGRGAHQGDARACAHDGPR